MITLGLDPSVTGFGWAIHDPSKTGAARLVAGGVWSTPAKMLFVERFMAMRDHVRGVLGDHPEVRVVGVESPPFGAQWSEGLYALFVYVNEAIFTERRDVVHFDPSTVKMLAKVDPAACKGKMAKSDMIARAKEDTGILSRWNNNTADAYLVAHSASRFWLYANKQLADADLTPAEAQAFASTHTFVKGKKAGLTTYDGAVFKENKRYFRFSQIS